MCRTSVRNARGERIDRHAALSLPSRRRRSCSVKDGDQMPPSPGGDDAAVAVAIDDFESALEEVRNAGITVRMDPLKPRSATWRWWATRMTIHSCFTDATTERTAVGIPSPDPAVAHRPFWSGVKNRLEMLILSAVTISNLGAVKRPASNGCCRMPRIGFSVIIAGSISSRHPSPARRPRRRTGPRGPRAGRVGSRTRPETA